MSDKKSHEEIIKRVCKEILLSNGLFQKALDKSAFVEVEDEFT